MKTLFIECSMGAAGDMLMAAFCELLDTPQNFIDKMNSLGLIGVTLNKMSAVKCGIQGTHIDVIINGAEEGEEEDAQHTSPADAHFHYRHNHNHVHRYIEHNENEHAHEHEHNENEQHEHEHNEQEREHEGHEHEYSEHEHSSLEDILAVINALPLSSAVRDNAAAVYRLLAEAEAAVHGRPVAQVHFHEVGMMDAIADIVGVCLLIELLAPDRIIATPVNVGSGTVKCAHGVLPVPAPATALLLKGIPSYTSTVRGELCTPTGAALLKYFASEFGLMPVMATEKIGYGMGKKDFEAANCLRIFMGQEANETDLHEGDSVSKAAAVGRGDLIGKADVVGFADLVVELVCNLDDMTGEDIAFAAEVLMQEGALDVFTTPIYMKKGRPAVLLTCVCAIADADRMAALVLKHTTTFGLRKHVCERYILDREFSDITTEFGTLRKKTGRGYDTEKSKLEYEDLARIAKENNLSLAEVRNRRTIS